MIVLCFLNLFVCSLLSSVQHLATSWTVALQASLSVEFSRQEYWSGLPFLSPNRASGMLNARKGIWGEFVFRAQYKLELVWFSTSPEIFATEIVLEAHTVSSEPENHTLQLENGFHDPRGCGWSQSPLCAHLHTCAWPQDPCKLAHVAACLCSEGTCTQATQYPNLEAQHFHCHK